jgi:ribosomal protein S19
VRSIKNLFSTAATTTDSVQSLPIVRPKAGERTPPIKTQARSATILPNFVGLVFQIHNGKVYNSLQITEDMVGHKLGEFSP